MRLYILLLFKRFFIVLVSFFNIVLLLLHCFNVIILYCYGQFLGFEFYINEYSFQMYAGACRNSLYQPSAMAKFAKNPPVPLVERYYQCVMKPYDAFFNALGLSLGNAEVYCAAAFGVVMAALMTFLLGTGRSTTVVY